MAKQVEKHHNNYYCTLMSVIVATMLTLNVLFHHIVVLAFFRHILCLQFQWCVSTNWSCFHSILQTPQKNSCHYPLRKIVLPFVILVDVSLQHPVCCQSSTISVFDCHVCFSTQMATIFLAHPQMNHDYKCRTQWCWWMYHSSTMESNCDNALVQRCPTIAKHAVDLLHLTCICVYKKQHQLYFVWFLNIHYVKDDL